MLRNKQTRLYYGDQGGWVSGMLRAVSFPTVEEALLFNRQKHLQETEVVILHSNERHKVVLPIGNKKWSRNDWGVAVQPQHMAYHALAR